jgi:mitochondrial fission protein ELM1
MRHDVIQLPASSPDCRPPVRIFVGTEDGQFRAERVFVWSIEEVRDRSRAYEIHLLKNLPGFDPRRWLTGFTNYRFLIPHLTQGCGRAIYNDVDQVYLRDPADLFDCEMERHGYLSINPRDTSVMLIDAARMLPVWPLDSIKNSRRKRLERRAADTPALWGELDPGWNARDTEYQCGKSNLVHFTTIHTQPWMPFPLRFIYQTNPVAGLWNDLEQGALSAGFTPFSEAQPSLEYRKLLGSEPARAQSAGAGFALPSAEERDEVERRLLAAEVKSLLETGIGAPPAGPAYAAAGRLVSLYDPSSVEHAKKPAERFDAVAFRGGLEPVSEADLAWLIESLFRSARRLLVVSVQDDFQDRRGWRGGCPRDRFFWSEHFAEAACHHPGVDWCLIGHRTRKGQREVAWVRSGGFRPGAAPSVWVLTDGKPGHTNQSLGLAEALGWSYQVRRLKTSWRNRISNRILGASRLGLDLRASDPLGPPWPDLVLNTGRVGAPVARWIARQTRGHTRVVQIGRRGADIVEPIDLAVTCRHFRNLPHRRRHETVVPINRITETALESARIRFCDLQGERAPGPIGLLVGGDSAHHRLDPSTARRLGEDVARLAAGREILAVTSPRTSLPAGRALADALGSAAKFYFWDGPDENPYLGILAHSAALVVTGDSESMLGEAVATGASVYVYPLPGRRRGWLLALREWVYARAHARPMKRGKGTVRPQAGLEALCSRALASGLVRVHRELDGLHDSLVQKGVAHRFGAPLSTASRRQLREVDAVASRVRRTMGKLAEVSEVSATETVAGAVSAQSPRRRARGL